MLGYSQNAKRGGKHFLPSWSYIFVNLSRTRLIAIVLLLAVACIYFRTVNYPFVLWDDDKYVAENPMVRAGLSPEGVLWAFTTFHMANWHPLTWISHMLDVSLFGMDPGAHHLMNVLLHAINSLLLFRLLMSLTGAVWRSAFVAALFAVHPLHVESVAWISERKDVLSALFFMLSLLAYWRYCQSPGLRRYLSVVLLFALGLLAKPMLVTLPFVLLMMDYWPLQRVEFLRIGIMTKC